jgi:tripartite-type tricarboxylate transporter receptor subunit TctC
MRKRNVAASISRRAFINTAAVAGAAALTARAAWAAYPERPIRLIVPFVAGGAVDGVARLIGKALSTNIEQAIVIENRGGAGGIIGMDAVAHAAADGYTMLLSHSGFTAMPGLYDKLPFDPVKDFDGVVTAASGALMLAANPAAPFNSIADLIAYAKANPGKLTYGSAGVGSTVHLAAEFFKRMAGVDLLHVPYKGAAPATTDLLGGQIHLMFSPIINVLPFVRSGQLRALAVSSATRSTLAPDLPTVAESGLAGFEVVGWYGLALPAGTTKAVLAKLNAETNRALASSELVGQLRQQGLEPVGGTPEEASARIRSDVAHWTKIIHDAGIKAQ